MIEFAPSVIADRLQALTRALDAHDTLPGALQVLDSTGAVLATATFPRPSSAGVVGNTLTLGTPTASTVSTTGIASAAKFIDGAGVLVARMSVGLVGSNAPVQLSALQLYAGGEFDVSIATLTEA